MIMPRGSFKIKRAKNARERANKCQPLNHAPCTCIVANLSKKGNNEVVQCDYFIRLFPVFAISPRKQALLKLAKSQKPELIG